MDPERIAYGSDARQFGDLYRPDSSERAGTVVLLHGGFWRPRYDLSYLDPNARYLAARGWTVWSLEYRRNGMGPWPATLDDVAAGVDHLRTLEDPAGPGRVVVVGHSAGGHLAAWVAGRGDAAVHGVVSLAGMLDLRRGAEVHTGGDAVQEFLGGEPDEVPERYAAADPRTRLPIGVPLRCVHGDADTTVPPEQSVRYVEAARAAGDDVDLRRIPGEHFAPVETRNDGWKVVVDEVEALLQRGPSD